MDRGGVDVKGGRVRKSVVTGIGSTSNSGSSWSGSLAVVVIHNIGLMLDGLHDSVYLLDLLLAALGLVHRGG